MSKTPALAQFGRWGFPYELRTFKASAFTAEEAAEALGLDPLMILKTLVVRGERRGYGLAVIPTPFQLSLRKLAGVMDDKRVEMIALEDLTRVTGYVKGGVSPFGTKRAMPVYLDQRAFHFATISVSAGQRGVQMLIAPAHLQQAAQATVGDLVEDE